MKRSSIQRKPSTKPKTRKCTECPTRFPLTPQRPTQRVCESIECVLKHVERNKEKDARKAAKAERVKDAARRDALTSRGEWLELLQKLVNQFRREEDLRAGHGCISCGSMTSYPRWQGGHFMSVGSHPELRFIEENIHLQCLYCNMHQAGAHGPYRGALIAKIGVERVEWLEGPHEPLKITIDEIKQQMKVYRLKIKEIRK